MKQAIKYYLGIDGGGTKTEFCLVNAHGMQLCSALLGASNPNDTGLDETCALLAQGIDKVTDGYDRAQISCFAGIAGAATGDNAAHITNFLRTLGFAPDFLAMTPAQVYSSLESEDEAALLEADGVQQRFLLQ